MQVLRNRHGAMCFSFLSTLSTPGSLQDPVDPVTTSRPGQTPWVDLLVATILKLPFFPRHDPYRTAMTDCLQNGQTPLLAHPGDRDMKAVRTGSPKRVVSGLG